MKQLNKEQLSEWSENPVTILFKEILNDLRNEMASGRGLEAFHPFDPFKTQEYLAKLNGFVDALNIVIDGLDGDWTDFEEDEEVYINE